MCVQEEITQGVVSLSVETGKMTADLLQKAVKKVLEEILSEGWREIDHIFRASLKEQPEDGAEPAALPDFTEGQTFDQVEAAVTEHFTAPP